MTTDREKIEAAIGAFPAMFGLRAYEGAFRVSERASYVNSAGAVVLYIQRRWAPEDYERQYGRAPRDSEELWIDFAQSSPHELQRQIVKLNGEV